MKTFGIIGTGMMGTDVAHVAATSEFNVLLYDISKERTESAIEIIKERLARYVKKGNIKEDVTSEIISRIKICSKIEDLKKADIILENVTEDKQIKKDVFRELDRICGAGTILASNTSSISITQIASATKRPESVIGMHFLAPAHIMNLVEIIPGLSTTRETFEMAKFVVKKMGKTHVEAKDFPGFLLNRMLYPMINEAIFLLYEGAGTAENIDKVTKIGLNLPMGPLALADMLGLDVVLAVAEEMYNGYSDAKYRPCPLLRKYVAAGYLGEKSGRGFYIYND